MELSETLAYFYYRTHDGEELYELEVELRTNERRFSRVVTCVVRGKKAVDLALTQLTGQ